MFVCLDQRLIPVLLHESDIEDDGASQILENKGVQTTSPSNNVTEA